jgi:hypothetical protein
MLNGKNVRVFCWISTSDMRIEDISGLAQRRERRREKKRIIDRSSSPVALKKKTSSAKKPISTAESKTKNYDSSGKVASKRNSSSFNKSKLATALLFCHSLKAKNVGETRLTVRPRYGEI